MLHFQRSSFTLIEVLVTTSVIGVLAGIVITAINPKKNLQAATDTKRQVVSREIEDALTTMKISTNQADAEYAADFIESLPLEPVGILKKDRTNGTYADISFLVERGYLSEIVTDSLEPESSDTTGFTIARSTDPLKPVSVDSVYKSGSSSSAAGISYDLYTLSFSGGYMLSRTKSDTLWPIDVLGNTDRVGYDLNLNDDDSQLIWRVESPAYLRKGDFATRPVTVAQDSWYSYVVEIDGVDEDMNLIMSTSRASGTYGVYLRDAAFSTSASLGGAPSHSFFGAWLDEGSKKAYVLTKTFFYNEWELKQIDYSGGLGAVTTNIIPYGSEYGNTVTDVYGMTFDSSGNIYIAASYDNNTYKITQIDPVTGDFGQLISSVDPLFANEASLVLDESNFRFYWIGPVLLQTGAFDGTYGTLDSGNTSGAAHLTIDTANNRLLWLDTVSRELKAVGLGGGSGSVLLTNIYAFALDR